jgi:bifunctional non-homologous end joining protein LigD
MPVKKSLSSLKKNINKTSMPHDIKPMLATLVDKPFDEEGWIYEVKWDGYRAIIYLNNGLVEMRSRNNKTFDEKFYPIHNALEKWKVNAVIDGEIIVTNDKGISNFSNLKCWRS